MLCIKTHVQFAHSMVMTGVIHVMFEDHFLDDHFSIVRYRMSKVC